MKKLHIHKGTIIKSGMILFLAVYLILLISANSAKDIPMDQISGAMEADGTVTALEKRDRSDLMRYYEIDESGTDGFLFYKSISPMSAEELLIVKAADSSLAEEFLEQAEAHLESQKQIFEGYGTEQMAQLNEAVVAARGQYVIYACGPEASGWNERFLNLI